MALAARHRDENVGSGRPQKERAAECQVLARGGRSADGVCSLFPMQWSPIARWFLRAAATSLAVAVAAVAVAGCGSSDDSSTSVADTATATAARAAATPSPNGVCGGPSTKGPYRLTMSNATAEDITWKFSGVDCAQWMGRTPMMPEYTPLTLGAGQSRVLTIDPSCSGSTPKTFTARLYRPSSTNPAAARRTVKLGVRNGDCNSDPTVLRMWAQKPSELPGSAFLEVTTTEVPTGGASWSISAGVTGKGAGAVRVSQ